MPGGSALGFGGGGASELLADSARFKHLPGPECAQPPVMEQSHGRCAAPSTPRLRGGNCTWPEGWVEVA